MKKFLLNEFICVECDQRFYMPDTEELEDYCCPKCGESSPDEAGTFITQLWHGEPIER